MVSFNLDLTYKAGILRVKKLLGDNLSISLVLAQVFVGEQP